MKRFILVPLLLLVLLWAVPVTATPLPDANIVIHVPSRTLFLYSGEKAVDAYPVGVGMVNFPTPEGTFRVIKKVENPGWEDPFRPSRGGIFFWRRRGSQVAPGPRNPIGTRWIGFHESDIGEYGIHGTPDTGSVGKFSSHGCVRMYMQDVEDLFEKVDVGTPVVVSYDTVMAYKQGDEVKITVFPDKFGKGMLTAGQLKRKIHEKYPNIAVDDAVIAQVVQQVEEAPIVIGKSDTFNDGITFKVRITNQMPVSQD